MDLDDSELYWTRKQKGLATEKETEEYIRSLEKKIKELEENYIPKSLAREKIEEYNEIIYYAQTEEGMAELKDFEYEKVKYGIQILAELLED